MKSYKDTVKLIAKRNYDHYMGGGHWFTYDSALIKFIYGEEADNLDADVQKEYEFVIEQKHRTNMMRMRLRHRDEVDSGTMDPGRMGPMRNPYGE